MFPWRERARHTHVVVDQGKTSNEQDCESRQRPRACCCARTKRLRGYSVCRLRTVHLSLRRSALDICGKTETSATQALSPPTQLTPAKLSAPKPTEQPEPPADPVAMIYAASLKSMTAEEIAGKKSTLLWSNYGAPRELAYEALELLQRAPEHGLDPERYALNALYKLIENNPSEHQLRNFDKLLTASVWSYNEDLRMGAGHEKIRKRSKKSKLKKKPKKIDGSAVQELANAIVDGTLKSHLEALPPTFDDYKQLQIALDKHNDFNLLGGWDPLPADMLLKPGDTHPAVAALRLRLIMTDGLSEEAFGSDVYDEQLQRAIERFQARHGLAVDGEIGPVTLKTLNISSAEKVRLIGLNLARLRQLPKQLPEDRISVNIPEFKLRMFLKEQETLNMGVVVGTKRTPTPAMRDKVRHLVFNPYWYPPRGITVKEILPRLRRDPGYLERSEFELLRGKKVVDANKINWKEVPARNFPYRLRQIPGEKNALGSVKFIFPNKQAIYLHDTPSRKLFAKRVRAFSHGCVRLEKPQELASALMNWDRGWTDEDVHADISKKKRKLRKFKERIAIHLLYQTASVTEGVITFHPDIYGHDRATKKHALLAPTVAAVLPKVYPSKQDRPPENRRIAAR